MNKFFAFGAAVSLAVAALADGPININNFIDSTTRPINLPTAALSENNYSGTGVLGATWRAQFVAADGTSIGDPVPFRSAGRLDFRTPISPDRTVTGTAGVAQDITVRVWDTAVFNTWADAAAAIARGNTGTTQFSAAGTSTFSYTIPVGTPPPIGADRIMNFQSFNLTYLPAVPEPTTIALGALGAAALLWRRRK